MIQAVDPRLSDLPMVRRAGSEPQGVEIGQIDILGAGMVDRGIGEVAEIERGDGGGDLIGVDGGYLRSHPGEGDGVRADPAPQVGDAEGLTVRGLADEAARVVGGDRQTGGLSESVAGEEHVIGEGTEFGTGLSAQLCLGEQRGGHLGGEALLPQGG